MPLQNLRFTFDQTGDRPEDRVVWSFGLDGPVLDNAGVDALGDQFELALDWITPSAYKMTDFLQSGMELVLAEAFPAEGGPATGVNVRAKTVTNGSPPKASEVQICVTRNGMTPRGFAPIGRVYIGPLANPTNSGDGRPSTNLMRTAGEFCQNFHITRCAAAGYVPVVLKNAGTVAVWGLQIDGHRVDDAWDTQRRRGWEPTTRVTIPFV